MTHINELQKLKLKDSKCTSHQHEVLVGYHLIIFYIITMVFILYIIQKMLECTDYKLYLFICGLVVYDLCPLLL